MAELETAYRRRLGLRDLLEAKPPHNQDPDSHGSMGCSMTTFQDWLAKTTNKTRRHLRDRDAKARRFGDRGVWDDPAQRDGIGYRIIKDGRPENDDTSWRILR